MDKSKMIKCAISVISGTAIGFVAAIVTGAVLAACPLAMLSSMAIMFALSRE